MAQHSLPEDPADWPDDPHELLGVSPGDDTLTIRRAYTALIRRYKPDQAPEQFRRIREAYEALRDPSPFVINRAGPRQDLPAASQSLTGPVDNARDLELESAWDQAIAGDLPQACARLRRLFEADPDDGRAALRLHWLISTEQSLSTDRPPLDWLLIAACSARPPNAAVDLLLETIEHGDSQILAQTARAIDCTADLDLLARIVIARWHAAIERGEWDVVEAEWYRVRARLGTGWHSLLLPVNLATLWQSTSAARDAMLQRLNREWGELGDNVGDYWADTLDYLDWVSLCTENWGDVLADHKLTPVLKSCVSRAWYRSRIPQLESLLSQIADDPDSWYRTLRDVEAVSKGCLNGLANHLRMLMSTRCSPREYDDIAWITLLDHFQQLGIGVLKSNDSAVEMIIDFCWREQVSPAQIAQKIREFADPDANPRSLAILEGDRALTVVCLARAVFWSPLSAGPQLTAEYSDAPGRVDAAWARAVAGDLRSAYVALVHEAQVRSTSDIHLRLYWLVRVEPALDANRLPIHWLVADLMEGRRHNSVVSLLARELQEHPETNLDAVRPLANATLPLEVWSELLRNVWQAALEAGRAEIIDDSWETARQRVSESDETHWLRLLCTVVNTASWRLHDLAANEILTRARLELARAGSPNWVLAHELDRLDWLELLTPDWRKYLYQQRGIPLLEQLIPRMWSLEYHEYYPLLIEWFEAVDAQPTTWLAELDALKRSSPAICALVDQVLQTHATTVYPAVPLDPPTLACLARQFCRAVAASRSFSYREVALHFCLDHHILPAWLAPHVTGKNSRVVESVADWSIQTICLVRQLYWAELPISQS